MRRKAATSWVLRAHRVGVVAVACLLLTTSACGGGNDTDATATDGGAEATVGQPAAGGAQRFDVTVDPSALPTTPLDREAFIDDACLFASAEQMAAFFAFHDGTVTAEGGNGLYAGTDCSYAMEDLDVVAEVQFGQSLAQSTEEIELAGLAGVLRNVSASTLENRARVQIPFRIERSPVRVVTIQFHVRGVAPADEEALRVAIDALGANLIERLGLEAAR